MKINLKGTGNQIAAAIKANYKPILTGIGGLLLTYVLKNSSITLTVGGDSCDVGADQNYRQASFDTTSVDIAGITGNSTEKAIAGMYNVGRTMSYGGDKIRVCKDVYELVQGDKQRTDKTKAAGIDAISRLARTMSYSGDKTRAMTYVSYIVSLPAYAPKKEEVNNEESN